MMGGGNLSLKERELVAEALAYHSHIHLFVEVWRLLSLSVLYGCVMYKNTYSGVSHSENGQKRGRALNLLNTLTHEWWLRSAEDGAFWQ